LFSPDILYSTISYQSGCITSFFRLPYRHLTSVGALFILEIIGESKWKKK